MIEIPKINFARLDFTPATFQGSVFKPQEADMNILARSLAKQEERQEKLDAQRAAISQSFAEARKLLPDNEETNQYITNEQNKAMNAINSLVSMGDYSNALTRSRQLARDFVSSPEFSARSKEAQQRKEWLADLDKSSVDNYIKEYYKDTYKDKNNFTRDNNGNITGTSGWEAPLPEQSQSPNAIIQLAIKATADERTDNASAWVKEDRTGGHSANKREILTASKIASTVRSFINNDPKLKQSFVDQFNAGLYQINKLTKELNSTSDPGRKTEIQNKIDSYKSNFYRNGAPISNAEEYINTVFSADNDEIKNAAYDYKHRDTASNKYSTGNLGDFNLGAGADTETSDLRSNAANVEVRSTSGASVPTRGVRPQTKGNRPTSNYVAPGNLWGNRDNS